MKRIVLGGLIAAFLVGTATLANAGPGRAGRRGHRDAQTAGRDAPTARRDAPTARRVLRLLDLTDAQREAIRAARTETASVREGLRANVRALLDEARSGDRTPETRKALREKVKAARRAAAEQVAPQAQVLVGSLSPEQRTRLVEAAQRHGRTVDDAKVSKRLLRLFERLLLAPGPRHGR